jgi:hypothetical protein
VFCDIGGDVRRSAPEVENEAGPRAPIGDTVENAAIELETTEIVTEGLGVVVGHRRVRRSNDLRVESSRWHRSM